MRRSQILLAVGVGLISSLTGLAQTTFPYQKAYLEANNIRASVNTLGSMWYDPTTSSAECEYPKGSGKNAGYASAVWIAGKIPGDTVVAVATTYNSSGARDLWTGPLNMSNTSDTATTNLWERIWNIRSTTIDSFRAIFNSIGGGNPAALAAALSGANFADLKAWPAKGSASAAGKAGRAIPMLSTTTRDYAPFVDVDGDGKYNYLMGDYPRIKGTQMLWAVYNDMAGQKSQTNTKGIGMEIQLSAYAYVRNPIVDNIQFYEYKVFNRGAYHLDSAKVSIWADMDLGYGNDDYIGFDSSHRMGYIYNARDTDGNGAASHYGANPPVAGVVLLETVGDVGTSRVPTGAFTYYSQGPGTPVGLQDPQTGLEFYRYMSGYNRFGQPFTNDFTGVCNVTTVGYGSGPATTTVFTGDPAVAPGWSECCSNNPPGDRRFILSSAPFHMMPGSSYKVAFALVVAPGGACSNISLASVQETADTAIRLYDNPVYATAVRDVSAFADVKMFPNPATAVLTVQNLPSVSTRVQVLDVMGRKIYLSQQTTGKDVTLNTQTLSAGVYLLQIANENAVETRRFVKE